MKIRIASVLLFVLLFAGLAVGQTRIQLQASWDNGSRFVGAASLSHPGVTDALISNFSGRASTTFNIQPNIVYQVTFTGKNPATNANITFSFAFIVPSVIIDPQAITWASYSVRLATATNTPVPGETQISVRM